MRLFYILATILVAKSTATHEIAKRAAKSNKGSDEKRVVCYYTNWSVYRKGLAKYTPQNINPYMCTHLVYAFGGLTDEFEVTMFDSYQDIEQGGYAQFNGLKQYNRNMKTLLALGGWNEGSARFSELVSAKEYRKNFTLSAIKHLRRYNFDGLDLDWEYPGSRDGSTPEDKQNYAILCQELREAFELEATKSSKGRLLLTMAVPAGQNYIDKGYNIPMLDESLDFFNILTYDYHSVYEPTVNHHAALFPAPGTSEYEVNNQLNIDWTVRYYLKKGASKNKLVVGIPTYGRSYTLLDADFFTIGSSADGPGTKGNYTNEKGYLAFYEICEAVSVDGWEVRKPYPKRLGPFAFKGNQWVGYDDEKVVVRKAEYVRDSGLGGVMFWTLDSDDFRGLCNGRQYPLIEAAKETLLKRSPEEENEARALSSVSTGSFRNRVRTSQRATTTTPKPRRRRPGKNSGVTIDLLNTPEPPTTPSSVKGFNCKREGFYPNPDNCRKYYWCLDSGASGLGIVAHAFTCPSDLIFNKKIDGCDHPSRTKCKVSSNRGGAKGAPPSSTTPIPTTTEFEVLAEDYDYYYDGLLVEDPLLPLSEVPQIEEPVEANIIEGPTRNAGGNQFGVEDPPRSRTPERTPVRTPERTPARTSSGREKPRLQYSSIQRDSTRVAEEPTPDEVPTAVVEERPSVGSRNRRPQYTTLNRQRPAVVDTVDYPTDAEPRIESDAETTTESGRRLTYVTLNRSRRPTTTPLSIPQDVTTASAGGREYVTLNRRRQPSVEPTTEPTTLDPLEYEYYYDELYDEEIPEVSSSTTTTSTSTTTTSTTTTTTEPPKIRIPPRIRQRITARQRIRGRPAPRPAPQGSIRRPSIRARARSTTTTSAPVPEEPTEETVVIEEQELQEVVVTDAPTVPELAPETTGKEPVKPVFSIEEVRQKLPVQDDSITEPIEEHSKPVEDAKPSEEVSKPVEEPESKARESLLEDTFRLFQENNKKSLDEEPQEIATARPFVITRTQPPASRKVETTTEVSAAEPETTVIPVEETERPAVRPPTRGIIPQRPRTFPRSRSPPNTRERFLPPRRPTLRLRPGLQAAVTTTTTTTEKPTTSTTTSTTSLITTTEEIIPETNTERDVPSTEKSLPLSFIEFLAKSSTTTHSPSSRQQFRHRFTPKPVIDESTIDETTVEPESKPTSKFSFPFDFIGRTTEQTTTAPKSSSVFEVFETSSIPTTLFEVFETSSIPTTTSTTTLSTPTTSTLLPERPKENERQISRLRPRPVHVPEETTPFLRPKPVRPRPTTEQSIRPQTEQPIELQTEQPIRPLTTEQPIRRKTTSTPVPERKVTQRPHRGRPAPTRPPPQPTKPVEYEYVYDYEYYDTGNGAHGGSLGDWATLSNNKANLLPDGSIECVDTGYFPHPESCKKFISCSKTVRGFLRGWIYTCPQELVFDPVGGMCNWTEAVDCLA